MTEDQPKIAISEIDETQQRETQPETQPESCKIDVSEKIDTVKKQDDTKKIYKWAASNIGESIGDSDNDKFFVTDTYISLLYRIQNAEKGLTMIEGLQGTGKSRIIRELSLAVKDNLRFKFVRYWKDELWQHDGRLAIRFQELLEKEFADLIEGLKASGQNKKLQKIGDVQIYEKRHDYRLMEEFIGKSRCKALREQAFNDFLGSIRVFLIDMQDYLRSNSAAMNNDVALIQEFYQSLGAKETTHIVVAAQKELIMNSDHFFWGKFTKYHLQPLSSMQLVDAYKLNNPCTEVFEPDALQYLSEVSRGGFRRFKKYICTAIENTRGHTQTINEAQVRLAVTDDVIFEDLDAELSNLFDDSERKRSASAILSYLRTHKDVNIKTIADSTGASQSMTQKIIAKLLLYSYVTIRHGEGKEKLVSLRPYVPVQPVKIPSLDDMPYTMGDENLSDDELQRKRRMWQLSQSIASIRGQ